MRASNVLRVEFETLDPSVIKAFNGGEIPFGSRREIAERVKACGYIAYVGGCHVAVHAPLNGEQWGKRLAVISGKGADWTIHY